MINAFTMLLACQLAGEICVRGLQLPLPGPVAGMGLLFCVLCWRGRGGRTAPSPIPPNLGAAADGLLRHLSLLFVPAAVGIIDRLPDLRAQAGPIAAAVIASTVLALAVTAVVFQATAKLTRKAPGEASP